MYTSTRQIAQDKVLEKRDYLDMTGAVKPVKKEKLGKILEEPDYVNMPPAAHSLNHLGDQPTNVINLSGVAENRRDLKSDYTVQRIIHHHVQAIVHTSTRQIAQDKVLEKRDYLDVTGAVKPVKKEKLGKILEEPDYVNMPPAAHSPNHLGDQPTNGAVKPVKEEKLGKNLEEPDYVNMPPTADSPNHLGDQPTNVINLSGVAENRWDLKSDYTVQKILGKGSFSTVYLADDLRYKRRCAIKVWWKNDILEGREFTDLIREKNILFCLKQKAKQTAPFFLEIYSSFLDNERLVFVLSYAAQGTLYSHLIEMGRFNINLARFYAAEIVLAVEHLHNLGIVHRNLKTTNILLDERMHIKISSFKAASFLSENERSRIRFKRKTRSKAVFYVPPDELAAENSECSRTADLWGMGSVIYEMISGLTPFHCKSDGIIIKNSLHLRYYFPVIFGRNERHLIKNLLVLYPSWKRLGALDYGVYTSLRSHPFFKGVQFETLYLRNPVKMILEKPVSYCKGEPRRQSKETGCVEYDDDQVGAMRSRGGSRTPSATPPEQFRLGISSLNNDDIHFKLVDQTDDPCNLICNSNLILLRSMAEKGSSLFGLRLRFGHRRMLILTLGPHLFYADPEGKRLEGEIPWAPDLWVECKNSAIFVVHTIDETYYFRFSSKELALKWCSLIEEMKLHLYGS